MVRYIERGRLRMEYLKQIMIDMGKNGYKELKELSYKRKAWSTRTTNRNRTQFFTRKNLQNKMIVVQF